MTADESTEPPLCRPTAQQVSKRMLEICAKEGLQVNQATMEQLAQVGSSFVAFAFLLGS